MDESSSIEETKPTLTETSQDWLKRTREQLMHRYRNTVYSYPVFKAELDANEGYPVLSFIDIMIPLAKYIYRKLSYTFMGEKISRVVNKNKSVKKTVSTACSMAKLGLKTLGVEDTA